MEIQDYDLHEKRIQSGELIGMYYTTPSCGVCHALRPKLEEMFSNLGIPFHTVDLVNLPKLASMRQVMGVPTLLVFESGREWIREGAYLRPSELENKLRRAL